MWDIHWYTIVFFLVVAVLIYFGYKACNKKNTKNNKKSKKEGFMLGALGRYKAPYFKCLYDCEREDPSKTMGPGHINCARYCDSVYTQIARDGVTKTNFQSIGDLAYNFDYDFPYSSENKKVVMDNNPNTNIDMRLARDDIVDLSFDDGISRCHKKCRTISPNIDDPLNSEHSLYRECMSDCCGYEEINDKCKQECAYSTEGQKICMKQCFNSYIPNLTSVSWTWK
jgi:hypothetical protein